jgi:hypothetical protein
MDQLHRSASTLVEEAAQSGEHPDVTFNRLRALAYAAAGRIPDSKQIHSHPQSQGRAPRLTESWFCCAEPTTGQFRPLQTKGYGEV